MANRSYLYACNEVPGTSNTQENIIGLSESNYAIPLTYKILLSGNPEICRSRIWNTTNKIAIIGEFETGLVRLTEFLKRITLAEAQPHIKTTLEFLNKPENKCKYFLLECGEIFDMHTVELEKQNVLLLKKIQSVSNVMEQALLKINAHPPLETKKRLHLVSVKPKSAPASEESLRAAAELGLNYWSNILYFDFSV